MPPPALAEGDDRWATLTWGGSDVATLRALAAEALDAAARIEAAHPGWRDGRRLR